MSKRYFICFTLICVLAMGAITACKKNDVPPPPPPPPPPATLEDSLAVKTDYSIFYSALVRTDLLRILDSSSLNLTVFAPDNNAFIASGLSQATVNALPLNTLRSLIQYHIGKTKIPSALFSSTFPNQPLSTFNPVNATSPVVFQSLFLGKNGVNFFVNNLPVSTTDVLNLANGVLHRVPFILQPPTQTAAQMLNADASLTLFSAMVQRGDVGQPAGLTRIDSALKYNESNLTVFAPNNASVKLLINGLSGGAISLSAPDAVFLGYISTTLPITTARNMVLYHILSSHAFSVNLPLTTAQIQTSFGSSVLLTVDRGGASPRLLGAASGAGNFSNFTAVDRNGINGILHVIDRVLLPQ